MNCIKVVWVDGGHSAHNTNLWFRLGNENTLETEEVS